MTTRRQSIRAALQSQTVIRAAKTCGLAGCPVGSWPETQQAMRRLEDALPGHWARSYEPAEIVAALFEVDGADRYRVRGEVR